MHSISGTALHECKQLRDAGDYLAAKAEKYRRWGLILANAGLPDMAGEIFAMADRNADVADSLYRDAHEAKARRAA